MQSSFKKWTLNILKIMIAVAGLYYVISTTPWNDHATIDTDRMAKSAPANSPALLFGKVLLENVEVTVLDQRPDGTAILPQDVFVRFPNKKVNIRDPDAGPGKSDLTTQEVLGQDIHGTLNQELEIPKAWLKRVQVPADDADHVVSLFDFSHFEKKMVDGPEASIGVGLKHLMQHADIRLLVLALLFLGIPFMVTSWRWMKLMQPQGIALPYSKCVALTFVGQFYSTFLPGSTSGDLIKIIYTSRVTGSKTKSTVTVLLDRMIGLIALMLIAGIAAAFQMKIRFQGMALPTVGDPTMRNIVFVVTTIFLGLTLGSIIYFSHRLRRTFGLAKLMESPRVPEFVRHADEVLHAYHGHRGTLVMAFLAAMFAQLAIPISAWIAGTAFGIQHANIGHYLAYVPLATLAAALPISFLGLGVMDSVVFLFFYSKHLADASQTFALAQCIRFLPVIWNMLGSIWVVTGTYSRHEAMEEDKKEGPPAETSGLDSTLDPGV